MRIGHLLVVLGPPYPKCVRCGWVLSIGEEYAIGAQGGRFCLPCCVDADTEENRMNRLYRELLTEQLRIRSLEQQMDEAIARISRLEGDIEEEEGEEGEGDF